MFVHLPPARSPWQQRVGGFGPSLLARSHGSNVIKISMQFCSSPWGVIPMLPAYSKTLIGLNLKFLPWSPGHSPILSNHDAFRSHSNSFQMQNSKWLWWFHSSLPVVRRGVREIQVSWKTCSLFENRMMACQWMMIHCVMWSKGERCGIGHCLHECVHHCLGPARRLGVLAQGIAIAGATGRSNTGKTYRDGECIDQCVWEKPLGKWFWKDCEV